MQKGKKCVVYKNGKRSESSDKVDYVSKRIHDYDRALKQAYNQSVEVWQCFINTPNIARSL